MSYFECRLYVIRNVCTCYDYFYRTQTENIYTLFVDILRWARMNIYINHLSVPVPLEQDAWNQLNRTETFYIRALVIRVCIWLMFHLLLLSVCMHFKLVLFLYIISFAAIGNVPFVSIWLLSDRFMLVCSTRSNITWPWVNWVFIFRLTGERKKKLPALLIKSLIFTIFIRSSTKSVAPFALRFFLHRISVFIGWNIK